MLPERSEHELESIRSFLEDEAHFLDEVERTRTDLRDRPVETLLDSARITELFRIFHTIKGTAALFGLEKMETYTHAVEEILQGLRRGRITPEVKVANFLVRCTESLKTLYEAYRTDSALTAAGVDLTSDLTAIREFLTDATVGESEQKQTNVTPIVTQGAAPAAETNPAGAPDATLFFRSTTNTHGVAAKSVVEVIRDPVVLPSVKFRNAPGRTGPVFRGFVRSTIGLVPLCCFEQLQSSVDSAAATLHPKWAIVVWGPLTGATGSLGEVLAHLPILALAADDVGRVIEKIAATTTLEHKAA